jgi:nitrogenase-stabilizing/protective protein
MNPLFASLHGLSSAEDIFRHFDVEFDQAVLNVNRLHILKRFNEYLSQANGLDAMTVADALGAGREMLSRSYCDFVNSSAVEQKVFRRLHRGTTQRIAVDSLRGSRGV